VGEMKEFLHAAGGSMVEFFSGYSKQNQAEWAVAFGSAQLSGEPQRAFSSVAEQVATSLYQGNRRI